MTDTIRAVDLFCGAGGLSTGLALACEHLDRDVELAAVNHWETAIETHERNHPWADHYHAGVEQLEPREVYPEGTIDLLIAAPECTHFSKARGGTPTNDQARVDPWSILDWVAKLLPSAVLVENVPEFRKWGPVINGSPTRNGQFFDAWVSTLNGGEDSDGLGYHVDHRVLNAADYGDPTSRERLFVVARRDDPPIWPAPTHSEGGRVDGTDPWRPAAEVIDWSERGESIWARDRPLVNNTMRRIAQGIRRYGDDRLEPYADAIADLDREAVERLQADAVDVAEAEAAAQQREEPFLVRAEVVVPDDADGERAYEDAVGLCVPTVKGQHGGSVPRDPGEEPLQTVATAGALQLYEPEPFVLPRNQYYRGLDSNPAYDPEERLLHTVTASNHDGHFVAPHLVVYNGESDVADVEQPVPTVTTRDRFGLVLPEHYPWGLDVRYRMLQPRELARAQGFPEDYEFAGGTKAAVTEQIGNAVPVNLATALCRRLLVEGRPTLDDFGSGTEVATDGGVEG